MDPRTRLSPIAATLLLLASIPAVATATPLAVPFETLAQLPVTVLPIAPPPTAPTVPQSRRDGLATDGTRMVTLDFAERDETAHGATQEITNRGAIAQFFDTIAYWITSTFAAVTDRLTPATPDSYTKTLQSTNPNDFWKLVSDAGYKLKEISTEIGVVPDVGFRFKYVRELSDGDVNWLERKLEHHAAQFTDPVSAMQRTIIYTLLSINSSDSYFVEELRVKLLPLPKAVFSLTPWDSGLSEEHDTLLRAIQGKKRTPRKPTAEDAHF